MDPNWLNPLKKALASLEELEREKYSAAIRDAWIQRFEYSLELCWKTAKRLLNERGIEAYSPKDVFRKAAMEGLIDDASKWLDFVDKRNLTSHIYNEEVANTVFSVIGDFRILSRRLLSVLEKN